MALKHIDYISYIFYIAIDPNVDVDLVVTLDDIVLL